MKIRNIVLIMWGSLLLPLAGALARVVPDSDATDMQSGAVANVPGLMVADGKAMEPARKYKKKSSKKKSSKKCSKKKSKCKKRCSKKKSKCKKSKDKSPK